MRQMLRWSPVLFLAIVGCSKGDGKIDVEKLPCTERRPTSGLDVPEGYIACTGPKEEIKVGDFVCKKGTTVGVYSKSKTLEECWVKAPVKVDGAHCTGGVALFPDGKLRRCQLESELSRDGLTMPKGAWITFTQSGHPRRIELPQGGTIGPYKCKGYQNFVYEGGKPKKCQLAEATTIDGQPRKADETVCFDEAGKSTDCGKVKL